MNQILLSRRRLFSGHMPRATVVFLVLAASLAFSDEWKARHALISPSGVMNLSEPPAPDEVFFSGPQDSAAAGGWLAGLKAWRSDRLARMRLRRLAIRPARAGMDAADLLANATAHL